MNKDYTDTIVNIQNLTVAYDSKPVLWDVNLKIPRCKLIGVVGPNGAGKSTLLKAILNLVKPVHGSINFNLYTEDKVKNKKNSIGYMPQNNSVDWDFPVNVIELALMGRYGKIGFLKRPSKKDYGLAMNMLDRVGIQDLSKRQIGQLSGGQQQRAFLARALVQDAEIYFMDEPFKGVDLQTEKIIIEILQKLVEEGKTVVVIHHSLSTVKKYFNYLILLNVEVIASGVTEDIFNEEYLIKTYKSNLDLVEGIFL